MFNEEEYMQLAEFYKLFSSPTRLKIILTLSMGEMDVNKIAENLNMGQSAISHQLKELRQSRIVKFEKQGKNVYYSLADGHIVNILNAGTDHIIRRDCHE